MSKVYLKISITFILVFMLLVPYIGEFNVSGNTIRVRNESTLITPIEITNNSGLAALANSGNGSRATPYVIENIVFLIEETITISPFQICNTTSHFIIRQCKFEITGNQRLHKPACLNLTNLAPHTAVVVNNTIIGSECGIFAQKTPGITILNNSFTGHLGSGALHLIRSDHSQIINNTCKGGINGLNIRQSSNITVKGNYCTGWSPIDLRNTNHSVIEGNFVRGYGGITLGDCENCTIQNNICYDNEWGIYLLGVSLMIDVKGNICYESNKGIYIREGSGYTIENNICYQNGQGIEISRYTMGHITIKNNDCSNNTGDGILVRGSNNIVENNTCSLNRGAGIYLSGRSYGAFLNQIRKNDIFNNIGDGIAIYRSDNNSISENIISNNSNGISIKGYHDFSSDFNQITLNDISSNREYGVHCGEESNNNLIFNNSFTNNNNGQTQGNDDGIDNQWHDETIQKGNYWSDWSGYGSYQIDGEANAADLYPEGRQGIGNNIGLIFFVGVLVCVIVILAVVTIRKLNL